MHTKFHCRGRLKTVPPFVPNLLPPASTAFPGHFPVLGHAKEFINLMRSIVCIDLYLQPKIWPKLSRQTKVSTAFQHHLSPRRNAPPELLDVFAIGE